MKVLSIVFNNFKNDSRVLKECRSLVQEGYDVTVAALHEEGLPEKETISGIHVHRIKIKTRKYSKNLPMQVVKYVELAYKMVKYYRHQVDIIHCNDILPLPIAVVLKNLSGRKTKIVYDAHEFQTETQKLKGKTLRKRLIYLTEKFLIKKVDKVMTVSAGIAEEYKKRYNIPEPDLVLNCPYYQTVEKQNRFREEFGIGEDKKILLYQGALTKGRGLEKLIQAFVQLQRNDAVLMFMGYGYLQREIEKTSQAHHNIYFHEAVSPDEILSYTASADIGISLIENSCLNYYYCLPNKLFEYGMAGLPVIVSDLPEMKKVVETFACGVVAKDITVEGFAGSIEQLLQGDLQQYAANALKIAQTYNWGKQEETLLNVYEGLLHT